MEDILTGEAGHAPWGLLTVRLLSVEENKGRWLHVDPGSQQEEVYFSAR